MCFGMSVFWTVGEAVFWTVGESNDLVDNVSRVYGKEGAVLLAERSSRRADLE